MPTANMVAKKTLNAVGLCFCSTAPAMEGMRITAHTEKTDPLTNASAASGSRAPARTRITSIAAMLARVPSKVLRKPKRCARNAAGSVPTTVPALAAPFTTPRKSSRKPRSSRNRL